MIIAIVKQGGCTLSFSKTADLYKVETFAEGLKIPSHTLATHDWESALECFERKRQWIASRPSGIK